MTAEINETGQGMMLTVYYIACFYCEILGKSSAEANMGLFLEAANHHDPDGGTTKTSNSPECEGKVAGKAKCSICQSTFRRPEHLKRHLRSHTKEKPFECARCGRHFSRTYVSLVSSLGFTLSFSFLSGTCFVKDISTNPNFERL